MLHLIRQKQLMYVKLGIQNVFFKKWLQVFIILKVILPCVTNANYNICIFEFNGSIMTVTNAYSNATLKLIINYFAAALI